jgi:hypothetical protein
MKKILTFVMAAVACVAAWQFSSMFIARAVAVTA